MRDDAKQVRWRVPSVRSSEQGPLVGLAVLLVVSLLTMKSGRRELVDKVKGEVISEGPETEGGCFTGLAVECPALTVSPWIGCGEPLLDELL